ENTLRIGQNCRLASFEVNTVNGNMSSLRQFIGQTRGVCRDFLLHGLLSNDGLVVVAAAVLQPVPSDALPCGDGSGAVLINDAEPRLLQRGFEITEHLDLAHP